MKILFCICFALAAVNPLLSAENSNLIQDGTFDGPEISAKWKHNGLIHDPADMKKFFKEVAPFLIRKIDTKNYHSAPGSLKIEASQEIRTIRNDKGALMSISNYVEQFAEVTPGKYEFSMYFRGTKPKTGFNATRVFIHFQGANFYKPNAVTFMPKEKNEWTCFKGTFEVPANVKRIGIRINYYGCGEMNYDDIVLRKVVSEK